MKGKLQQALKEFSERCVDILRKCFCRAHVIPSIPDGVVRKLFRRKSKG